MVASAVSQAANDKQQPRTGCWTRSGLFPRRLGKPRKPAGGYGLFQRDECRGLREGGDRAVDRQGPSAASPAVGRALRSDTGSARKIQFAGRDHGASAEARRQAERFTRCASRSGACFRDHQIGAGDFVSLEAARHSMGRAANGASSPWHGTTSGCSPASPPDEAGALRAC